MKIDGITPGLKKTLIRVAIGTLILSLFVYVLLMQKSFENISEDQLYDLINENKVVVIDVRTQEECVRTGIIPGSKMISLFDDNLELKRFALERIKNIKMPEGKSFAIVSRNGSLSGKVSSILSDELPQQQIFNLRNGIIRWKSQFAVVPARTGEDLNP